jgi:hypothetical protein
MPRDVEPALFVNASLEALPILYLEQAPAVNGPEI